MADDTEISPQAQDDISLDLAMRDTASKMRFPQDAPPPVGKQSLPQNRQ